MKVIKTINNNIVTCLSSDGREQIAMGKGLGFDFKAGSELDESRIEKIFSIEKKNGYETARDLFSNMPEELLNISIEIIDSAKEMLNTELNDSIYITLTDHINFALSKSRRGLDLYSAISADVKVFYPREYLLGKNALKRIEKTMNVEIQDDEACAIALHIVNAEYNTEISSIMRITETIADVLKIIRKKIDFDFSDDDVVGASFISFFKYFVFRIFQGHTIVDKSTDRFPALIKNIAPECIMLAELVEAHIMKSTKRPFTDMDKAILASNIYGLREYCKRR